MAERRYFITVVWLVLGVLLGFSIAQLVRRQPVGPSRATAETAANQTDGSSPSIPLETNVSRAAHQAPVISPLARLRELCARRDELDVAQCLTLVKQLSAKECRAALDLFRNFREDESAILQRTVARRWANLDAENLLDSLPSIRDGTLGRLLAEEGSRVLVKRDPESALRKLSRSLPGAHRLILAHALLPALAEQDPARAGAFLTKHPEFARDENVFRIVASHWAQKNSLEALAWAESLPAGRSRSEAIKAVGSTWAQHDPAAVAAEISRNRDRWDGDTIKAMALSWSKMDPRAAMAWIDGLPKADQEAAWSRFRLDVRQLGTDATLELLSAVPSEQRRAEMASQIASELARENPRAAMAWAERLPEGELRTRALRPALDQLAASNPVEAVGYVASLPAGDGRTDLLRRAVASWAVRDTDAAMAWTRQLPAGWERDEVFSEAARGLREFDLARAARLSEMIDNVGTRHHVIQEIAGQWARTDGAAAAQWLGQMPDAATQVESHYSVARHWGLTDMEGSANWINSLPHGASRDAAVRAFVTSIDGYDAALATSWAMTIQEPAQRQESVGSAFGRWLQSDPTAARSWLETTQLADDVRATLTRVADTRSKR